VFDVADAQSFAGYVLHIGRLRKNAQAIKVKGERERERERSILTTTTNDRLARRSRR
jgi:hypothetical protein